MRSLSSDKESELSLLIFVPKVLWRKARPDHGLRRKPPLLLWPTADYGSLIRPIVRGTSQRV
jgi:hypothetical protein